MCVRRKWRQVEVCEKERETNEGVRRKEGTESVCEKVETTECLWDVGKKGGQLNVCRKKEGGSECMGEKRGRKGMCVGKKEGRPNGWGKKERKKGEGVVIEGT